jgi:hypothetical protein
MQTPAATARPALLHVPCLFCSLLALVIPHTAFKIVRLSTTDLHSESSLIVTRPRLKLTRSSLGMNRITAIVVSASACMHVSC